MGNRVTMTRPPMRPTRPIHKKRNRWARPSRRILVRSVGVAVVCGGLVQVVASASGASSPPLVRADRLASHGAPSGSVALGSLSTSRRLDLAVVLAPSDPAGLQSLLTALYDVHSPQYHHWLQHGQFLARFGPTKAAVSSVEQWLHRVGLTDTTVSGLTIDVAATAGRISHALGVNLERYRTRSGVSGFVAPGAPLVPSTLSGGQIEGILGLDSLAQYVPENNGAVTARAAGAPTSPAGPAPHASPGTSVGSAQPHTDGLTPCAAANTEAGSSFYTLDQLGAAYGVGALLSDGMNGHGQTIALYELGQHSGTDVSAYETCFGLGNPLSTVTVDGGAGAGAGPTEEANADIEQAMTQAPGASIISYEGPNTGPGQLDVWSSIIDADVAQVVSTSWGICEQLAGQSFSSLFTQAATQGQTILAASGDSGTEDCFRQNSSTAAQVDYPASDPLVTGVGGTTLFGPGDEVVWNVCQSGESVSCANGFGGEGAGGGGLSRVESKPSYQPEVTHWNSAQSCGTVCREVPDISANAGIGMVIYDAGSWTAVGGTSLAAPFIAGIVADKNDGCTAATGNLNPALYGLWAQGVYGTALNDIIQGDNDLTGSNGGQYTAGQSYDAASGVGSPIPAGLSCPEVASVQPPSGAPGSQVTVTGLGLEKASVFFGNAQAQVVGTSATSATVVVPSGGGGVSVHASSVMGSGTSAASFDITGSGSVPSSGYDLVGRDGGVFVFPTNQPGGFYGSLPGLGVHVNDIEGMVPSPDDRGYFLVGQDGGVFAFGDAPFLGSLPGLRVHVDDIKGIVPTNDNRGYFLVGQDGGVFAFGDAPFLGSLPGRGIHIDNVIGIAATPSDQGYWVVAANGTVYAFGNAPAFGSATGTSSPVAGIASTPDGGGYWIVTQNGNVFGFGDARLFGTLPGLGVKPSHPVIGLVPTADDNGYWLIGGDGGIFAFGDAPFVGSLPGLGVHVTDIVGAVPTTP